MTISFDAFYNRLLRATDIATQMELARALGVNRSAVTQAKRRDAVPQKWILALSRHYGLSPDWLEFGKGQPRVPEEGAAVGSERHAAIAKNLRTRVQAPSPGFAGVAGGEELVHVPKATARLCAGGGSFEVEAAAIARYPFPRRWLSKLGSPSAMVFMDVVGDSMEPGIRDGDMVLVDMSLTRLGANDILAVGVEDSIYLKRVERKPDGLVLHSDNPVYSPMELYGDELDTFRVLGRVVWMCRERL